MSSNKLKLLQISALAALFCSAICATASAGWHWPVRTSETAIYMPRIAYSGGVIHTLYYDLHDEVSYCRSTDQGGSWSNPIDMTPYWSCYPELSTSGDSVIAMWMGQRESWYNRNYIYRLSTNGGANWSDTSKVFVNDRAEVGNTFSVSIAGSNVFFVYGLDNDVYFSRSTNFGVSWNGPRQVSTIPGLWSIQIESIGDTLLIITDGEYMSGRPYEVYFLKSTDRGTTWTSPEIISSAGGADANRSTLAINTEGHIAVAWTVHSETYHGEIFLRLSDDLGDTWNPTIENTGIRTFGALDVACAGDTIHIVSEGNNFIIHTQSTDNGATWAAIDTVEHNRYDSYDPVIVLSPGMAHVVWDDRRVHNGGLYYSRWEENYVPPDSSVPDINIIGSYNLPRSPIYPSLTIDNNTAFIGGFEVSSAPHRGIEMIDVSNPTNPTSIGGFDNTYTTWGVAVSNNFAYAAWHYYGGLAIYDISDPENIILTSVDSTDECARNIYKKDNLVFLVNEYNLEIFDVTNPFEPELLSVFDSVHYAYLINVVVVDNLAYLACTDGLFIIDISDPALPLLRGRYTKQGHPSQYYGDVAISGNYAYLAFDDPEIQIVDISDPDYPSYAGTYLLDYGYCDHVVTQGHFLVAGHDDLTVLDISDPIRPIRVAKHQGPPDIDGLAVDNENIYAFSNSGNCPFMVFQLPALGVDENLPIIPRAASVLSNYPNPFNAQTTIRYSLPESGPVNLTIYNLLGQKVATLVDGVQTAGEHSLVWDADQVSSGIYLAKLCYGQKNRNILLSLIK